MSPVKKVRGDARFLNIQGTPVKKAPVQVVASYSGEIGPEVLGEFKRRYGYMDYVVLQKRTADGPSGRVYAWKDGSLGANAGLAAAKPGAKGTVLDEKGSEMFAGELFDKHDLVEPVARKVLPSPDGTMTAKLCEAGFPGLNLLLVKNEKTGKETTWQAGSRNGDLYLDAQWVGKGLVTYEGKPDDLQLLQVHEDGHYVREVLGAEQLFQDGFKAGLDLAEEDPTLISASHEGDQLSYRARFTLVDGTKTERDFEGRFEIDDGGKVHVIDRKAK